MSPLDKIRRHDDADVNRVLDVLSEYGRAHSEAKIDAYRQNSMSIRVRIVDPDFHEWDRVEREMRVWAILERLPPAIHAQITLLLLLTPKETDFSFVNFEFDNPLPSRL